LAAKVAGLRPTSNTTTPKRTAPCSPPASAAWRERTRCPRPRMAAHPARTGSDSAQPRSCGPPFSLAQLPRFSDDDALFPTG
jgi:hypothetical protein